MHSPRDRPDIRALFEKAGRCGNRYRCPSEDKLVELAQRPGEMIVPAVAFEIMHDHGTRSWDQLGRATITVLSEWAAQRARDHAFDEAAGKLLLSGVRDILSDDATTFRPAMYSLFAGPTGDALPESKSILEGELLKPGRDDSGLDAVASSLQYFVKDLSDIGRWLRSGDPVKIRAGLALLDRSDHRRFDATEELRLLKEASASSKLSVNCAYRIIAHVKGHEDPRFAPVLEPLTRYSDPEVAAEARAVRKDLNAPGGAPPGR